MAQPVGGVAATDLERAVSAAEPAPRDHGPWLPWMRRALQLAELGRGRTSPNPLVGAVVLNAAGGLVGEGYHERAGAPHAEVGALRQAGEGARGGTLVVSLEPCCHHGRTPPCSEAVIAAGIQRVVLAMRDPNPQVDGGGIARLRAAGLAVIEGVVREVTVRKAGLLGAAPAGTVTEALPSSAETEAESTYTTGPPPVDTVRLIETKPGQITTP